MSIKSVSGSGNSPVDIPISTGGQSSSQSSNAVAQDAAAVKSVQTGKELRTAELEGMDVSLGDAQLIKAIDRAVKAIEGPDTTCEIKMHEATKTITIKVMNKETGELIREIPPEKTLDLVAKMMEFAGILIDRKV
ncbi:flagellar protein FlaG [Paenibacillus sp. R14(2021)]|uniref:flagellar protein FlaG n=1 Tax=Paenibacillus sp. R14(2021) TaxID=2859228 RepID=UPI0021576E93|nr:flagellar protein FlaG [Paenibacillus sp. R14(2021)]